MKEEIPQIKQMMKDLTNLMDKFTSQGNKDFVKEIIEKLKELAELCSY